MTGALDAPKAVRQRSCAMKSLYPLLMLAALAACQKPEPTVIDTRPVDPNAAAIANAAPVELPPAIKSQKTYRCKDNSLAYVTWYVGDKQADAKVEQDGAPTRLTSAAGGSPWTSADGWSLSGNETDITLTTPGKAAKACHV